MIRVAQALAAEAQLFGVTNLEEAMQLRESVGHPIMILGPALPEEREPIVRKQFIPSVSNLEEAMAFDRTATNVPAAINFVIDTGMGDGDSSYGCGQGTGTNRNAAKHATAQHFHTSSGCERRRRIHPAPAFRFRGIVRAYSVCRAGRLQGACVAQRRRPWLF